MSTAHRHASPPPPLERLAHFRGSALTSRDLRDLIAYEERLLRLHVCTLHDGRAPAPRLAFGIARPGALEWTADEYGALALLDTRDGEFDDVPLYFASLSGGVMQAPSLVGPFVSIDRPRRRSFTLRLTFASQPPTPALMLVAALISRLRESSVLWIGVEQSTRCAVGPKAAAAVALDTPDLSTIAAWLGGHP